MKTTRTDSHSVYTEHMTAAPVTVFSKTLTPSTGMGCADCGMFVEPAMAFHPFLYCQLFKLGVLHPAKFLEGQHFIPDPGHWGKDAPRKQRDAAGTPRG